MSYSEEARRKAEKRIDAIAKHQAGDRRGIYKNIAIDLQCRLNELEEVLRGVEQRFAVVGAWQGSIPCADVPVECNADEVRALLNNSSLILPSTSEVAVVGQFEKR